MSVIFADDWATNVNAIATLGLALLTILLVVLTGIYVCQSMRQSRAAERSAASAAAAAESTEKTARAQLWLEAQRIVRLEEFYEARKRVMALERPLRATEWTMGEALSKSNEKDARLVCRDMDQLAWLVQLRAFPNGIRANIWDDTFSKTWIVLKLFLLDEQKSRGPGNKWDAFRDLGEAELKRLGWPRHWSKPDDDLLRELGWTWDAVKWKEGLTT